MKEKYVIISRFNFWNEKPNLGFHRKLYLEKLSKFENSSLIKVLVGQRRVGKSYILRQVINGLLDNGVKAHQTFYINKEFVEYDFINDYTDLVQTVNDYIKDYLKTNEALYLFIDEVQNINQWEKAVNAISQDFTRTVYVYLTGSNAELLSGELATLLSGRYVEFLVLPFTFSEFCEAKNLPKDKKSFLQFMQTGALPELFNLRDEESKRYYLSSLYDTVLLRDIVKRNAIRDIPLLQDIFTYLANNVSKLFSVNKLSNYFKSQKRSVNYETVAQYVDYLEKTFLIHKCDRYDIKGKDTVAGNAKFYLNDLSFKNYLYSGYGLGFGYLLENLVYLSLLNQGFEVYVGYVRDKEVDFVAKKNEKTLYVQSTYLLLEESTIEREYQSLLSIRDNYDKIIVSLDDIALPVNQGIKHILAWELDEYLNS
jgi:uncharacterized protein